MNFYKLNNLILEEIEVNKDESGVDDPVNDKSIGAIVFVLQKLIADVKNEKVKKMIQEFIDKLSGTTTEPSKEKAPEKASPSGETPAQPSAPPPASPTGGTEAMPPEPPSTPPTPPQM